MEYSSYKSSKTFLQLLQKLFTLQIWRPGPVLIDITKMHSLMNWIIAYEKCTAVRSYKADSRNNIEKVQEAAAH